jgi:hypothetical protein
LADQPKLRFKSTAALIKGLPSFNQTPPVSSQKKHPGYFTIRNLDPTRYRVKINGQEQPTSHMSGNELIIAISVEHVVVEIVDKITNVIVQAHDTRINKTYEITLPSIERRDFLVSQEIVKNAELKLNLKILIPIISLLFVFGLGFTGWQLGWFGGAKENSPSVVTTANAIGNSTDNSSKKNEIVDTSKTVKPKVEATLPSEPKPMPLPSPKPPGPKPQAPQPPKLEQGIKNLNCATLERLMDEALHFRNNIQKDRVEVKKQQLLSRLMSLSDVDCKGCKLNKDEVKATILRITGY